MKHLLEKLNFSMKRNTRFDFLFDNIFFDKERLIISSLLFFVFYISGCCSRIFFVEKEI